MMQNVASNVSSVSSPVASVNVANVNPVPSRTPTFDVDNTILVNMICSVDRAVSYDRIVLEQSNNEDGSEDKKLETKVHYKSTQEAKVAQGLYAWARNQILSVCVNTPLGFVCPMKNKGDLERKIQEIQEKVAQTNLEMKYCSVYFNCVPLELVSTNINGAKEIKKTLCDFMDRVKEAIAEMDPVKVKKMLSDSKHMEDLFSGKEEKEFIKGFNDYAKVACIEVQQILKEANNNIEAAKISLEQEGKVLPLMKKKFVL